MLEKENDIYENAKIEIIKFASCDIITTSQSDSGGDEGDNSDWDSDIGEWDTEM